MPIYFYFFLTLLIELPIVLWWLRNNWKPVLLVGILLNLLTWPILLVLISYTHISPHILEIGVAVVEGIGYALFFKRAWWQSLAISFLVNGLSYGIGLLL